MGRAFKDNEKEVIKANLLKKGRAIFSKNGLKKTSIEELTESVGIARGSFYAFYGSKEELYFEVLKSEEKEIGADIEKKLCSIEMTRGEFKQFLLETVDLITGNPFLTKILNPKDYQSLISKISKDKFEGHLQDEYQFTSRLITKFQEQKHMKKIKPEILSGLLYTLFLLQLHQNEIGEAVFPELFEFLIDIISDTLVTDGTRNFDKTEEKYLK